MSVLIVFIQKAIVQGICILYGALGEIMTEKSGNLNLGIPGVMVPHDLPCGAAAKCLQLHFPAPFTMAMNASSNFSQPVWAFSSSGVPRARRRPSFMTPTRSDRASASSI